MQAACIRLHPLTLWPCSGTAPIPSYLYRLSFVDFDRGMALCEAAEWLDCAVHSDIVFSDTLIDITPCAYLAQAIEIHAVAASFEELLEKVRAAQLPYDGYSIDSAKALGAAFEPHVKKMGSMGIAKALADVIPGMPNLDAPADSLWAICLPDANHPAQKWIFGRRVSRYDQAWSHHAHKPHSYSSSVNPRHARALVNIVTPARLNPRTFIDPCAGAGTVLIEAASRGLSIFGVDIGFKIVQAARGNLEHYGFPPQVIHADAADLPALMQARAEATGTAFSPFDGAVVDFPYGHFSPVEKGLYERILTGLRPCVKRLVTLTPKPASDLLTAHGFNVRHATTAAKSRLVRHITFAE